MNIKSEKGSVTLFVLISCMFFLASVTCVQIYMQNKQIAVDREYTKVKQNYESNILEEERLKESYNQVSQYQNIEVIIDKTTVDEEANKLIVEFHLNTANLSKNAMRYGLESGNNKDNVTEWTYVHKKSINEKQTAIKEFTETTKTVYLWVIVDGKEICTKIQI